MIPIVPNKYKVLPDLRLLKGDRGCGCLGLVPYPNSKRQYPSSPLSALLFDVAVKHLQ